MRTALETYDVEVLRAELRGEMRAIRGMEDDLRRKINAIDAGSSEYLLRKVAALEARVKQLEARQAARDAASARFMGRRVGESR